MESISSSSDWPCTPSKSWRQTSHHIVRTSSHLVYCTRHVPKPNHVHRTTIIQTYCYRDSCGKPSTSLEKSTIFYEPPTILLNTIGLPLEITWKPLKPSDRLFAQIPLLSTPTDILYMSQCHIFKILFINMPFLLDWLLACLSSRT